MTIAEFLERVYSRERLDLASGSLAQLEISVRLFDRWMGSPAKLAQLSAEMLLDWMRWLADGRAPRTVNSKRASIITLWRAGAEKGLCEPPPTIPKRREPERIPVAWTLEEVKAIFAACDRIDDEWAGVLASGCWKAALSIFWDTACRLDSVMSAEVSWIALHAGRFHVPAEHVKGKRRDRLYTLHPETVELIAATLRRPRRMLFPFPWGRKQVWPHLKRILADAGLPNDRTRMFHCIRRTAESYAARERGIEWAAAAVGHSAEVARKSYISPTIYEAPRLIDAIPRPL